MQLTRFTDYALRTLMLLGSTERKRMAIDEIAEAFAMNRQHLTKVVHRLGQLGYVETTRGKGGGVTLAKRPEAIGIGDVVREVETSFDLLECFDPATNTCPAGGRCVLEAVLAKARDAFLAELDFCTLADVIGDGGHLRKVLGVA